MRNGGCIRRAALAAVFAAVLPAAATGAPLDHLGMRDFAIGCRLDGWAFFALQHGFRYSNSLWDEVNNYMGDQCVNIYPGASYQAISTRNAEAIREAVRRFRATRAEEAGKGD